MLAGSRNQMTWNFQQLRNDVSISRFVVVCCLLLTAVNLVSVFPDLNRFGEPKLLIFALVMGSVENLGILFCLAFSALLVRSWSIVLFTLTAIASFFSHNLGIEMSKPIIESVFETNGREVSELLSIDLILHLLVYAGIPIALTAFLRIKKQTFKRRFIAFLLTLALFTPFYAIPHLIDAKGYIIAEKCLLSLTSPQQAFTATLTAF